MLDDSHNIHPKYKIVRKITVAVNSSLSFIEPAACTPHKIINDKLNAKVHIEDNMIMRNVLLERLSILKIVKMMRVAW